MVKGIANRILRVDLTNRRTWIDEPDEAFYRKYLGGACFVPYFLLNETKAGIDPLSPDNLLIFALGPMTGMPMPGAARNCVGGKSPLTGGIAKSEVGGHFGWEMKRAGFDAIVVQGRADRPVYLWLHDATAEIRDALHIWGRNCLETQDTICDELGDSRIRFAAIGPAGENMVRFACVTNDLKDAAGRGGTGAIMGSKNLKAVAVRGRGLPSELADPDKINEMGRWMNAHFAEVSPASKGLSEVGTGAAAGMIGGNETGNLPVRNWSDGFFEGVEKITADAVRDTVGVGMEGCSACNIRCKKVVAFDSPYKVDPRAGGPEYETLAMLGSMCGVDDLKAICRGSELCNLYSLDTISTGGTIAFAMECFENEMLTTRDTGGIELRFGNADAMVKMVEMIAKREGIGDILAEGSRRAAEQIGHGAQEFAMQAKGLEIPAHAPRLKQALGMTYAIEAHGADHVAGMHDTMVSEEGPGIQAMRSLGHYEPLPVDDLGPSKVAMAKVHHIGRHFLDSLVCCSMPPWKMSELCEIVSAITGWDFTTTEALLIGERAVTLNRVFNIREGFTAADDALPRRYFSPTPRGGLKDTAIDPEAFRNAIHTWYYMFGWDRETGIPTQEKLAELSVPWAAQHLPSA
jgi:aldehyde:ferredoxin oxidoreductase